MRPSTVKYLTLQCVTWPYPLETLQITPYTSTNTRWPSNVQGANGAKSFRRGDTRYRPVMDPELLLGNYQSARYQSDACGKNKTGKVSTAWEKSPSVREIHIHSGRSAQIRLIQIQKCRRPEETGQKPREQHCLEFLFPQSSRPCGIPWYQRGRRHGFRPHGAPSFWILRPLDLNENMKPDRLNSMVPLKIKFL